MGAPSKCSSTYRLINGRYQLVKDCPPEPAPQKCSSGYRLINGSYKLVKSCPETPAPTKCSSGYRLVNGRYRLVEDCPTTPAPQKTCPSGYRLVDGRYQLVQQSRQTLPGADGRSYPGSCTASRTSDQSLSGVIATVLTDKTVTAQELASVWNTFETNRTGHSSTYRQFVASIRANTVTLSSGAQRLLFDVGHWIKRDWGRSPLAKLEGRRLNSRTFLLATLDHYGGYKGYLAARLGSTSSGETYTYQVPEGAVRHSISLFYAPVPYLFKELKAHETLRVNLDATKHYVVKKSISNGIQELRQLAQTATSEEGWLQVTVQPSNGAPQESYFYEVGIKEKSGQVTNDASVYRQVMRHAARRGRVLKVIDYHIHPAVGHKGSSFTWPPSAADLTSLHSNAQWFRTEWPDLPPLESGIVSNKGVWRLTLTSQGLAASESIISKHAVSALQCMQSASTASSATTIGACYNHAYFSLTHRGL